MRSRAAVSAAAKDMAVMITGSEALDRILGGGLPTGSLTVLAGPPGTGKTVVAQQTIFANAARGERALYLTTYSEPLSKLVRYLEQFAFYDSERMFSTVVHRDLGARLRTQGVRKLPEMVADFADESRCSLLVIDSFKALHDLISQREELRLAVFDTAAHLSAAGVTALWLGEYAPSHLEHLPEFAVADGIVQFANRAHGVRDERSLRVLKMRGARTLPGEHTFSITNRGIEVFPRPVGADPGARDHAVPERVRTHVDGLDELVGGGLWQGTTTLVMAPSGGGKTMLGLTFLIGGTAVGEPGLLLTLQEDRHTLRHIIAGIAGDGAAEVANLLAVDHRSPLEVDLVDVVVTLKEQILARGVKRMVVDALGDLREAAIDPSRLRSVMYNLVRFCAEHGVTLMISSELAFASNEGRDHSTISSMSDNILLVRHGEEVERTITAVKTRRSAHDPRPHRVEIDSRGFHVVPAPRVYAQRRAG